MSAPFIFVSYAHADNKTVLPIIDYMKKCGINLWYDSGIEAGSEWPEFIAEKVVNCTKFLSFISNSYLNSQNCKRELNYAVSKRKELLSVFIEDVKLTPGVEMQLGTYQSIFMKRFPSYERFLASLCSEGFFSECKAEVANHPMSTNTPSIKPNTPVVTVVDKKPQTTPIVTIGQNKPQQNPQQVPVVITQKTPQRTRRRAQTPQPQGAPVNLGENDIIRLLTFSSDGTSSGMKRYSQVFLDQEFQYIGISAMLKTICSSRTVTLKWQVFSQSNRPFTGINQVTLTLKPGQNVIYQQWGAPASSRWPVGKYYINASINNGPIKQTTFEVKKGCYDVMPFRSIDVQTFAATQPILPYKNRVHTNIFSADSLDILCFSVTFPKISSQLYTTVDYLITDSKNRIVMHLSRPFYLESEKEEFWIGERYPGLSHWPKDKYNYSFSLGKSHLIQGSFEVV